MSTPKKNLKAGTSVSINASPSDVWHAITTPSIIKKYLMGTEVSSDWKEGSPIEYTRNYEGKAYRNKGSILKASSKAPTGVR